MHFSKPDSKSAIKIVEQDFKAYIVFIQLENTFDLIPRKVCGKY